MPADVRALERLADALGARLDRGERLVQRLASENAALKRERARGAAGVAAQEARQELARGGAGTNAG